MKRALLCAWMLVAIVPAARAAAEPPTRVYAFKAFLDGKPIGEHRFAVAGEDGARKVTSEADFAVKIIGITAYCYRHHAEEQWAGDRLSALASSTDGDGQPASVKLAKAGDANEIATNAGKKSEAGCLMTYAYWNPAMREQTSLVGNGKHRLTCRLP